MVGAVEEGLPTEQAHRLCVLRQLQVRDKVHQQVVELVNAALGEGQEIDCVFLGEPEVVHRGLLEVAFCLCSHPLHHLP